ncbi:dihydrolipoamide acetyltransferase family protein [Rhodococcus maanshanensis]|uniref:Dihydrolipoamide acetyltransferase component of pyruvate dehydrogenase complex n=1 Tax=Rhodococcus maanshanensis TaxID=183556 RepID=A0A1H7P3H1_9NOCA|nr:dihydrolipoamide acetyltransferase family protein [Rhodococcus maanshanensis]SEL29775.1 pyruvate dehydrogenase E2 component (dihydrolipoamide acetyltransferase) [Rhodococcus maanshanensis]
MIDILMPRLSDTMTEGAISAWHKQPGDPVSPGDLLVEIETDKAIMEQEAYEAGILVEIFVAEGENVPIGVPIARLDNGIDMPTGTDPAPLGADPSPASAPTSVPDEKRRSDADRSVSTSNGHPGRRVATPLVRKLARERGIDLATVSGTGPAGRIVRADLDARVADSPMSRSIASGAASVPPSAPLDAREPQPVPFDAVRQAIATRLTQSGTTVPTFTVTASADVGELLELRGRINHANAGTDVKVSVNDILVRAVGLALRAHPGMNASYAPDGGGLTLLHQRIHVGIAVASPSGLIVPVVRDADRAAVTTISATTRGLVGRAADRKLTPADMSDGTFTISNLGMYGIEHFTAIINPPQGAILAVGAAREEPALDGGTVVACRRLRYTITADHRIIDGSLAAQFLATLTGLLENPLRIVG